MYWLFYSSHTYHHPSQTPCVPWISYATQKLMLDSCKVVTVWSIPYIFVAFYPSLKQNFIAYHSSKVSSRSDCIFEIHQLWQSGFSRVYSNCCCSCWFEPEIIKIGQSSHKMYSNNIVNSQESTTILNARTKKVWKLIVCSSYHANNPTVTLPFIACIYSTPPPYMVKAMNCGIVVCEFVLQSRYYVHFRANTLGKGMNPLILPPAMGK